MHIYNMLIGSPVNEVKSNFIRITPRYVENVPLSRRIKLSRDPQIKDLHPKKTEFEDVSANVPYALKEHVMLQKCDIDCVAKVSNDVHTLNPFFKFEEERGMETILYLAVDTNRYVITDYQKTKTVSIHESFGSVDYLGALITLNQRKKDDGEKSGTFSIDLIEKETGNAFTVVVNLDESGVMLNKHNINWNKPIPTRSKKIQIAGNFMFTKVYVGTLPKKAVQKIINKHAIEQKHQGSTFDYYQVKNTREIPEKIKDITANHGIRTIAIIDSTKNHKTSISFRDCKALKINYLFRIDIDKTKENKRSVYKKTAFKILKSN